jgi:hypothetical protein
MKPSFDRLFLPKFVVLKVAILLEISFKTTNFGRKRRSNDGFIERPLKAKSK